MTAFCLCFSQEVQAEPVENQTSDVVSNLKSIESSYAFPPSVKTIKETAIYWYLLSRHLEKINDYENSLKLSQAILYLSRTFERNYYMEYVSSNKRNFQEISRIGCKSILVWASKPKPQNYILSKDVAKDILDFVKTEYPISFDIKQFRKYLEKEMTPEESHSDLDYYQYYYNVVFSTKSTSGCKKALDEVYESPLAFIDKPLYDINSELYNYHIKTKSLLNSLSPARQYLSLFLYPDYTLTVQLIKLRNPNFIKMKLEYEQKLSDLEFTAIALAVNSYASQNNKMPESMAELSKWFGEELPKNRLTNKPYVLDLKGEHLLYNKGINGVVDLFLEEEEGKGNRQNSEPTLLDLKGKNLLYFNGKTAISDFDLSEKDDIYFDFKM